jgi:uncharacterized protein (DUF58 family)
VGFDLSPVPQRRLSWPGLTAMLLGLGLVAAELRYSLVLRDTGRVSQVLVLLVAMGLSVWGLKELIAGAWPHLGTRGIIRRRNRFYLPAEGRLYAVILSVLFVGSLLGRSNTLLLVFSLMSGPFVINGWITYSMLKGLRVSRAIPPRVMAGETFSVELTLENPKFWLAAWLMTVRDRVDNGVEGLRPEVLFMRVPRQGLERGRYQLRLSQRGRYRFGPIQVNTRFPLGLVERGLVRPSPAEILVYPRVGRLTSSWRRQMLSATQLVNEAQPRMGAFDDDFHRIREYRAGDDPRAIHWRSTARRSELMVREFRESRDRHLVVLLDCWLPANPVADELRRFEFAVSLAATMCVEQLQSSRSSGAMLATNGLPARSWSSSSAREGWDDLLDLLADLRGRGDATLGPLLWEGRQHQTSFSRTVLITPFAARAQLAARAVPRDEESQGKWRSEPPQIVVADPVSLAPVFTLEKPGSNVLIHA